MNCFLFAMRRCGPGAMAFLALTLTFAIAPALRAQDITARLSDPTPPASSVPGFQGVEIASGDRQFHLPTHGVLNCIPASKAEQRASGMSAVPVQGFQLDPSRCFFRAGSSPQGTLLLFVGAPVEPGPGPALLVGFDPGGRAVKLFEDDSFRVIALLDRTPEGVVRIVGNPTISEAIGCPTPAPGSPEASTYDPFFVYELRPGRPPRYLLDASRQYNTEHYVWIEKPRRDSVVLTGVPGHPSPMSVKRAELDRYLKCKP